MNVAQAQSQYETAAAQIPQIESQIAADRERAVDPARPQSGTDCPRQVDRRAHAADGARRSPLAAARTAARPDAIGAAARIAANAQIGAAKALYFPTISLTGASRRRQRRLCRSFSPARRGSGITPARSPVRSSRFGAVSGQVAQAEAGQQAALYNYQQSIQNAFSDVDNALIASQKVQEQVAAQGRLVARIEGLRAPRDAAIQRGLYVVHHRPAGGAVAVPRRAHARFGPRPGLLLEREHLQGDGGGWVDLADQASGATNVPISERTERQPLF